MAKVQTLEKGSLRILSNHPVLDQVARDIMAGVDPAALPPRPITVFVGLHRKFGRHSFARGYRLVLQTEHYFDADGRPMWRRVKRWRTLKAVLLNHRVLDLSEANRPHYAFLPAWLLRRVDFGPHIFPSHPPAFREGEGEGRPFLFAGSMNPKREAAFATLPQGTAEIAPEGTFGPALDQMIAKSGGVLNLHYAGGRYSEMPRLLSACLAGKAVMSERLGPEVEMGRDYAPLGPAPSPAEARALHQGFWQNFAALHRFTDYLRRLT